MSNSDEVREFLAEAYEYLDNADPLVISLKNGETTREAIDTLFRIFHSIKGVSGFLGFGNVQKITHGIEELLDKTRQGVLTPNENIISLLLESCDFLRVAFKLIEQTDQDNVPSDVMDGIVESTEKILASTRISTKRVLQLKDGEDLFPCFTSDVFLGLFQSDLAAAIASMETILFELLDSPDQTASICERISIQLQMLERNLRYISAPESLDVLSEYADYLDKIKSSTLIEPDTLGNWFGLLNWLGSFAHRNPLPADALETQPHPPEITQISATESAQPAPALPNLKDKSENTTNTSARSEIRVEMEKMDRLVVLIEELGVVTGVVSRETEKSMDQDHGFLQATNKLRQITGSLQDVAMSVRLVPMTATFKKMTRLVHDVSSKLSKKVDIRFNGEKTELDRNMVEALQDPLVHIFRNAIDHGIETPQERLEAGKSPQGNLLFEAWLGGGEVFLSLKDDGKGMDPSKIFAKAVEKGIVSSDARLTEKEMINLIFEPGFSTRSEVTDFSGRGVGMDVVKQSILGLGGNIEVTTTPGQGSHFLIGLPLMSTIVEALLVKVGDVRYSVRVASVRELFSVNSQDILHSPDGGIHVRLRNQIHPLLKVGELQSTTGNAAVDAPEDAIMILVENKGQQAVLMVDEILGTNHGVIKALPPYIGQTNGISGCSVIGTGSEDISWTLDINHLMRHVSAEELS